MAVPKPPLVPPWLDMASPVQLPHRDLVTLVLSSTAFSAGLWLRIQKMSAALTELSRAPFGARKQNSYINTHTNDNSTSQRGGYLPPNGQLNLCDYYQAEEFRECKLLIRIYLAVLAPIRFIKGQM